MSRSPIGLRQSVGGDINLADCIASWRAFACSRTMDFGFVSGSSPAVSQISFATREETRTNSSSRKAASLYDFVSFIMAIRVPSSIPWGCGGISLVFGGRYSVESSHVMSSPSGGRLVLRELGFTIEVGLKY